MSTYYVGSGGNDGNSGLTWALRKLTLNGAEDVPVVAGDTVYVAPGVYRELLTVDVSGGAGTEITYIGDTTGEHTDGIGGIVRITGSDNDQATARASCITANGKDYRIFQGFALDTTSDDLVILIDCENVTIQDCSLHGALNRGVDCSGVDQASVTIQRCLFSMQKGFHIYFQHSAGVDDSGHTVRNCLLVGFGNFAPAIRVDQVGGVTISHCTMLGTYWAAHVGVALSVGQTVDVENCIIQSNSRGASSVALGWLVEDYNTFYANVTDRVNVNVGGNSVTYPGLFEQPLLLDGYKFPWWFGELSEWSQIAGIAGTSMLADDMRGETRPTTDSKKSWGAIQYQPSERDTGTVYDASTASLTLPDAGRVQFKVPTADSTEITIAVRVYREANYAGTNPRLIVKQPGQADDTTTDAAAASQWNELTTTLTPADEPDYVIVELASLNTAVAGNYATFFDSLSVDSSPTLGDMDNWITDRIPFEDIQAAGGGGAAATPIFGPSTVIR